ncbi:RNA-binding protein MEX3B-like isoform X2 [Mizuhopecten yessoensis]|uniref:RNA-binding protein MEX3B-like isoform X2 n=1 Tax=Mizuhopecten yessoensis TaxID=6573 RepID=UPI000B45B4F0|nr:RNA-binding protein MEX3B-like isoform X2 [Mizuhopecten yessoensis]
MAGDRHILCSNSKLSTMPASLYNEMNPSASYEEQRALQLAFELSMMGLNGTEEENGSVGNSSSSSSGMDLDAARKRGSANMTECVPVPSSEHVAEIVGRQGCKIKALRAKTNTYIKTPVRGEEPVFVVTGRKEDVNAAKREILSAAEHFSQIRASRRNSSVSSVSSTTTPTNGTTLTTGPPSPNAPGQVTIQVRVPYRVVGLVVGPKGATIKRIQQQTHTYIVTPSRDKEPVFEVTGLTENVEKARQEIESHIALRTGGLMDSQNEDDFRSNGVDSGFHELNGSGGEFNGYNKSPNGVNGTCAFNNMHNALNGSCPPQDANIFSFPPVNTSAKISEFASNGNGFGNGFNGFNMYDNDEGIGGSPSFDPILPPSYMWGEYNDNRNSTLVSLFSTTSTSTNMPRRSSSLNGGHRLSPTLTDSPSPPHSGIGSGSDRSSPSPPSDHALVRRIRSDPLASVTTTMFGATPSTTFTPTSSEDAPVISCTSTLTVPPIASVVDVSLARNGGITCPVSVPTLNGRPRRQCFMCSESDIVAALVPCGHNLFCMECANLIVEKPQLERSCPVCQQAPTQAIRIFS